MVGLPLPHATPNRPPFQVSAQAARRRERLKHSRPASALVQISNRFRFQSRLSAAEDELRAGARPDSASEYLSCGGSVDTERPGNSPRG